LFGAKFVFSRSVTALCARGTKKILRLSDGREIAATAVLIATGAKYKSLEVPALQRFIGVSVFYTTFGETRFVQDLDVVVIGGGNSAGQAAIHLAGFARRVILVVRANSLEKGMSDYLIQQIRSTKNIEVRLEAEVVGGNGGERLESLDILAKTSGAVERIPATVVFVLIGATPNTDWLDSTVQRTSKDFIVTGHDVNSLKWPLRRQPMSFETSMPGVFAVGDVRLGSMKRVASAVGEGAGAVQNVHEYLEEWGSTSVEVVQSFPTAGVDAA
jgi:thioredoxin reductase (NADPH)